MDHTSAGYIALHTGEDRSEYLNALNPPVFLTSLHTLDRIEEYENLPKGKYLYGRYGSVNEDIVQEKIAALEHGTRAFVYPSGMGAATAAIMACCKTGDHVVCVHNAYGPVQDFLENICEKRLGIGVTFVHGDVKEEIEAALQPNTKLLILESPGSATFTLTDLKWAAELAACRGIRTYTDNSYCSPIFQTPLDFGIDLVMHSATKYLGGHSDLLGGVLVTKDEELAGTLAVQKTLFGGIMGPMEAWLLMRGLRTLPIRMKAHSETGMAVAAWLEENRKIRKVYYPGLESHPQHDLAMRQQKASSGLLSFEIDGSYEQAMEVVNRLRVFGIGPSWGGFESLAVMPFMEKSEEYIKWYGGAKNLIRIHCGLEGEEVLIEDLEQALSVVP